MPPKNVLCYCGDDALRAKTKQYFLDVTNYYSTKTKYNSKFEKLISIS